MKEGQIYVVDEFSMEVDDSTYTFGITTKLGMLVLFWYSVDEGKTIVQYMETMKRTWIYNFAWCTKLKIWLARRRFANSLRVVRSINNIYG